MKKTILSVILMSLSCISNAQDTTIIINNQVDSVKQECQSKNNINVAGALVGGALGGILGYNLGNVIGRAAGSLISVVASGVGSILLGTDHTNTQSKECS